MFILKAFLATRFNFGLDDLPFTSTFFLAKQVSLLLFAGNTEVIIC